MDLLSKLIAPALAFILTLAFGVWVSRAGKPYNTLIFTVHKLAALAAVGLIALKLFPPLQAGLPAGPTLLVAVAVLGVIALFATGALLSADKLNYARMRLIHQMAPAVTVLATALAVYLLRARL